MKVVHTPIEIAGQMGMLSKGLMEKDVKSIAWNTFHTYLGYKESVYNMDIYELETLLPDAIAYFDLFHFHYAATMATDYADLRLLKSMQKPMIMHHWGNDVRIEAIAKRNNPYAYAGDSLPPEQIHAKLSALSQFIDAAIVQDYEVLPYVSPYYKKVYVLPIAIDIRDIQPFYPSAYETNPLILHAPTNPLFKGTAYIEAAIERLKSEGFTFRYERIEHLSNDQALQLYQAADIVVDQILCGSYGMLAVEAMSMGKVVVGYIRDDLLPTFPDIPLIYSTNPTTIYDVLKHLLLHPKLRHELGVKGRKYAKKVHDVRTVASQLLAIYKEIV